MERPLRPGIILAAAIILPSLIFAAVVRHENLDRQQSLQRDGTATAMLAREQTLRIIQTGVLTLERAENAASGLTWAQIQSRRAALQTELRQIEETQAATVAILALVRPDGRVAAAGGRDQAPNANAGTFEAVRAARSANHAVTFETPPPDLASQGAGLVIGRGRAPEGRPYDGVVLAVLRAEAFFTAWAEASNRPGTRVALIRNDGTVLLRQNVAPDKPILTRTRSRIASVR